MIAALYVRADGPYAHREDVDPWHLPRDAREYGGPYPVVAHPPCARWGRYWSGGPSVPRAERRRLGDDGGCFAAALASVRRWGGALEHPEASHAWARHGLVAPPRAGGWIAADSRGGWTCCVEQGAYGHPARKATWLYAFGVAPPTLIWRSNAEHARAPEHCTSEERRRIVRTGACQRLSHRQRELTPPAFAEVLIALAATARPEP